MTQLPPLPYDDWRPTRETLHLYAQVIGKIKLASTPPRNHWWNVPLYLDTRGLTTRRLRSGDVTFSFDFDLLAHELVLRTDAGARSALALRDGLSVAAFHRAAHAMLADEGIEVTIDPRPFGTPISSTPFAEDEEHRAYDADAVQRFWRVLSWVDWRFEEFAGWYSGKTSPVHLFWHSFDLALTRFSGREAAQDPAVDPVTREAYSHEVISFGFWPGDRDVPFPAFYSYTAPEPAELRAEPLHPSGAASWRELPNGSMALLPYDAVREAADPREALLSFLQSAYDAGSRSAAWERERLRSSWCPDAEVLADLLRRQGGSAG